MPGNARKFALEIDRDFERAEKELREAVSLLALQGLTRIIQRTPVDTGRARGNWSVSIGAQSFGLAQELDPSGSNAISEGQAVIASFGSQEGWPSIFIQNNLPYIERLEDGYSGQAPNGMVALTLADLQAALR